MPLGAPGSLRNMLRHSLGAGSFAGFWRYWNPIFGYVLGRYVYAPLQRILPRPAGLVLTFVACGALHDLVIAAVRGSVTFLFTAWFLTLGLGVVVSTSVGLDLSRHSWAARATVNLVYLGGCLALSVLLRKILQIP